MRFKILVTENSTFIMIVNLFISYYFLKFSNLSFFLIEIDLDYIKYLASVRNFVSVSI